MITTPMVIDFLTEVEQECRALPNMDQATVGKVLNHIRTKLGLLDFQ